MSLSDRKVSGRASHRRGSFVTAVVLLMIAVQVQARGAETSVPSRLIVQPVSSGALVRVEASHASFRELVSALAVHLDEPIALQFAGDRVINFRSSRIAARDALERAAAVAGLELHGSGGGIIVTDPAEPLLDLDVKDADVRTILRRVKTQCGISNMLIDPEVTGRGTFLFNGIPCSEGIRIILASLGLSAEVEPNVIHVRGGR